MMSALDGNSRRRIGNIILIGQLQSHLLGKAIFICLKSGCAFSMLELQKEHCDSESQRTKLISRLQSLVGWSIEIGTSESSLGSNSSNEISSRNSRLRLSTSDRLPGAVLQARARLLERLRGISLTGSRQSTSSSGISWDEFVVSDDFRVVDLVDWETDAFEVPEPGLSFLDSIPRADRSPSFHEQKEKKPPGLTWEAINMLPQEAFKDLSDGSNAASKASSECSICLDRFWEGDTLIRLACGHLFHPECLTPWVQTCGDCPYCRSRIVNPTAEKRLSGVTH